ARSIASRLSATAARFGVVRAIRCTNTVIVNERSFNLTFFEERTEMRVYVFFVKKRWRRRQDSNLQAITRGSFQDYCLTNSATSPHLGGIENIPQFAFINNLLTNRCGTGTNQKAASAGRRLYQNVMVSGNYS